MSDYPKDVAGSLAQAISDAISRRLLDVHTCIPGIVESYDATKQVADVAVAVNRFTVQGVRIPGPKIPNVPIMFPKSARGHMCWPLSVGDEVLLLFSERDIDAWRKNGRQSDPLSIRKFSFTDAVAIPGCHSEGNAATFDAGDGDRMTIYFDGVKVVLTAMGTVLVGEQGSSQTEPVVLGSVLKNFLDALINALSTIPAGLTTSPGQPVGLNPALTAQLASIQSQYLTTATTNILSQLLFTERGGSS